jgi:hypothetical protein
VTLWEFLNARAERRVARQKLLVAEGLDFRSLAKLTFEGLDARLLIAAAVIGLFAWALSRNPSDPTFKGALIAGFAAAWGYYLGSSRNAATANERSDAALSVTHEALRRLPPPPEPDVTLKPGETARAEPAPEA